MLVVVLLFTDLHTSLVVTFSGVDVSEPLIVPLLPEGDLDTVLLQHGHIVIY